MINSDFTALFYWDTSNSKIFQRVTVHEKLQLRWRSDDVEQKEKIKHLLFVFI